MSKICPPHPEVKLYEMGKLFYTVFGLSCLRDIKFKILTMYHRHGYLSRHQTIWVRCMILIFVLQALIELVDLAGQFFLSILKLRISKSIRF